MDEDDRESNASSDQDEVMEDAEDADMYNEQDQEGDPEPEEEDNDDDQDDGDRDDNADEGGDTTDKAGATTSDSRSPRRTTDAMDSTSRVSSPTQTGKTPQSSWSNLFPSIPPEALTARLYDIVPTMAAPQATSINAIAITPDLRYWMTGGSDGYIRKYDGPGTINGKQLLTVAQRHPFVDSVTKAGILMSYWENEEPGPPNPRGNEEHVLSPVYSLAVHSQALWLLSGLESGGINLQSVRHDEGKRITCLQRHTNAVSVLTLAQDEKSVLSGGWDKNIFDWDLNVGEVKRSFDGTRNQVSAIEPRPVNGAPIPAEASELYNIKSETFSSTNDKPPVNNSSNVTNGVDGSTQNGAGENGGGAADTQASPAHESLFGGSDTGSLFGETGNGAFGGDDDDEFSRAMEMALHDGSGHEDGGMDHSADIHMANSFAPDAAQPPTSQEAKPDSPEASKSQPPVPAATPPAEPENTAPAAIKSPSPRPQTPPAPTNPPNELQSEAEPGATAPRAASGSPSLVFNSQPPPPELDPTQSNDTVFFSAAMDGTIRIWDRRVQDPVARIGTRPGVPPWCMGACWSPDGNWIYAGRRNGTVEEYSIHKARSGWDPERTLKFPNGSGAVSAVRSMPNGRHLVCASHDILRLYDTRDTAAFKHSSVPFLIIPGPPRAGVISTLYIDRRCRFMISAAGTRGWEGSCTEALIGYEINIVGDK